MSAKDDDAADAPYRFFFCEAFAGGAAAFPEAPLFTPADEVPVFGTAAAVATIFGVPLAPSPSGAPSWPVASSPAAGSLASTGGGSSTASVPGRRALGRNRSACSASPTIRSNAAQPSSDRRRCSCRRSPARALRPLSVFAGYVRRGGNGTGGASGRVTAP